MKILFCSQNPLVEELGAPKVLLGLADAMTRAGCDCTLVGPEEVDPETAARGWAPQRYSDALRRYLARFAGGYDVVEYDHVYLPFPREEFSSTALLVARSVLLAFYEQTRSYPLPWRARVGRMVKPARRRAAAWAARSAMRTVEEADLVNVSNWDDRDELVRRGVAEDRIVVQPFGLSAERFRSIASAPAAPSGIPVIAFVGTFDYRKGALDFPEIVRRVHDSVPGARFRLLGTRGLMRSAEQVLQSFPEHLRGIIEVVPAFPSETLPSLLRGAWAGVFPSYYEGFGFGVLEMMAAGLPVVAYRAPGPPMMLRDDMLVEPGDTRAAADALVRYLRDPGHLAEARAWATQRAAGFNWDRIATDTLERYRLARERLAARPAERRGASPAGGFRP